MSEQASSIFRHAPLMRFALSGRAILRLMKQTRRAEARRVGSTKAPRQRAVASLVDAGRFELIAKAMARTTTPIHSR